MGEISEKDLKDFEEWSEGNKYLFELLCSCKRNGIRTFASCGGHEVTLNTPYEEEDYSVFPYIGIVLEDSSLEAIRNIVNILKQTQNIEMKCFERFDEDENKRDIGVTIFSHHSNCCEMFDKVNVAVNGNQIIENQQMSFAQQFLANYRARQFMKSAEKMLKVLNEGKEGTLKEVRFDTYTKEMLTYIKSEGRGFGNREKIKNFSKLYKKYGILQREYEPKSHQQVSGLIESSKRTRASWDLGNWDGPDRPIENASKEDKVKPVKENEREI